MQVENMNANGDSPYPHPSHPKIKNDTNGQLAVCDPARENQTTLRIADVMWPSPTAVFARDTSI